MRACLRCGGRPVQARGDSVLLPAAIPGHEDFRPDPRDTVRSADKVFPGGSRPIEAFPGGSRLIGAAVSEQVTARCDGYAVRWIFSAVHPEPLERWQGESYVRTSGRTNDLTQE